MSEIEQVEYEEEEENSEDEFHWKPEYTALKDIIANQQAELSKAKKAATKQQTKAPMVKEIDINGKKYQAIVGSNGRLKYLDGHKLRDVKNKQLYQQFLEEKTNEEQAVGSYAKYRKQKVLPKITETGNYKVPAANTQTYRQILSKSIIQDAWNEVKESVTGQKLKIYNAALKVICDKVIKESGIKNIKTEANRNSIREYVIQQLDDKSWCKSIKRDFINAIKELND